MRVIQLIQNGCMRPAGLAAVEAAKSDGRWERAYAGPATISVPADFEAALSAVSTAAAFFETLNKTNRYSVLWRIQTASPTSRGKRIETLIQMLAEKRVLTSLASGVKRKRKRRTEKSKGIPKERSKNNHLQIDLSFWPVFSTNQNEFPFQPNKDDRVRWPNSANLATAFLLLATQFLGAMALS